MRSKDQIILEELYDDVAEEQEELEPLYIRGEYWFDEDGTPIYADGDIGDMGHEAHVLQILQGELMNHFDLYSDEYDGEYFDNNSDEIYDYIIKDMLSGSDLDPNGDEYYDKYQEIEEQLKDNGLEDTMIDYLKTKNIPNAEELVTAGLGRIDAREYAIKNWKWSRVHGNSIEVKELTPQQLKIVARGINNALDEEGVYDDEDWLRASQSEYIISTYTGKRYEIKLEDMERGNVQGLERNDIETPVSAATQQVRQMDMEKMPSFYKGVMGDSFKVNDRILLERIYDFISERAFHGSPHEIVGNFSLEKIGSGEGNQVYGWGLYFADNINTAQSYKDNLSKGGLDSYKYKGKEGYEWQSYFEDRQDYEKSSIWEQIQLHKTKKEIEEFLKEMEYSENTMSYFKSLPDTLFTPPEIKGFLYEVEIDADKENDFLDWDKPAKQQNEKVINAYQEYVTKRIGIPFTIEQLEKNIGHLPLGSDLYNTIETNNPQKASLVFKNAGVKGIKYLDQGSRKNPAWDTALKAAESYLIDAIRDKDINAQKEFRETINDLKQKMSREETYNYVIFDPNIIRIVSKNGEFVMIDKKPKDVEI